MKATIKYDFNDEEDRENFDLALKAPDMLSALDEIKTLLRSWDKYGLPEHLKKDLDKTIQQREVGEDVTSLILTEIIGECRAHINTIIYERVGDV